MWAPLEADPEVGFGCRWFIGRGPGKLVRGRTVRQGRREVHRVNEGPPLWVPGLSPIGDPLKNRGEPTSKCVQQAVRRLGYLPITLISPWGPSRLGAPGSWGRTGRASPRPGSREALGGAGQVGRWQGPGLPTAAAGAPGRLAAGAGRRVPRGRVRGAAPGLPLGREHPASPPAGAGETRRPGAGAAVPAARSWRLRTGRKPTPERRLTNEPFDAASGAPSAWWTSGPVLGGGTWADPPLRVRHPRRGRRCPRGKPGCSRRAVREGAGCGGSPDPGRREEARWGPGGGRAGSTAKPSWGQAAPDGRNNACTSAEASQARVRALFHRFAPVRVRKVYFCVLVRSSLRPGAGLVHLSVPST